MHHSPVTLARLAVGLVLAVLIVVFVGIDGAVLVVQHMDRSAYVIRGGSMAPAIPLGALVFAEPVDPASVVPNDIITFRTDNGLVFTHRVVSVVDLGGERQFLTRGDANATPDPTPVPANAVQGRLTFMLPAAGYVVALLELPSGVLCVMSLLCSLLLLLWLLEDLEPRRQVRPTPVAAGPTPSG